MFTVIISFQHINLQTVSAYTLSQFIALV
jgi:hypothetical protein